MSNPIEKVSIIVSKGSLEGVYPALIMANGARVEGIEANLFFTFFGLDVIHRSRVDHIKVATVGNPGSRPRHPGRCPPGGLNCHDALSREEDGEARHPPDPRVR